MRGTVHRLGATASQARQGRTALVVLMAWIAAGLAVAAQGQATVPRMRGGGAWFESSSWTLDGDGADRREEPVQRVAGVWADLALSAALSARVEVSGAASKGLGSELTLGETATGSLLLAYEPRGAAWRLQAGLGLPAGPDLAAEDRSLLRRIGEPVLGFSEPAPVRGWQAHLAAVAGVSLTRTLALYGGAALDLPGAYDAAPREEVEPGSRLLMLTGLRGGDGARGWGLELSLGLDGRQKLGGEVIRNRRTHWGLTAEGGTVWGPVRFGLETRLATSNSIRWPSGEQYLVDLRSDPGRLGIVSGSVGLMRGARLGDRWWLRPVLAFSYRRFLPQELPYADGWSRALEPGLEWEAPPWVFDLTLGWVSGRWRPWCEDGRGEAESIDAARVRLACRWRSDAR